MTDKQDATVPPSVYVLILSFVPLFLGVGFLGIIISAWLVTVGFTATQAGALIAAQGIAVILTSIPLGIVSDVYGRKYPLILGNLAGAVGLLIFAFTLDFWYLLAASIVLGFAEGAAVTTWNALLADLVEGPSRNRVFSLSFVMINVTTGVGLALPGAFPAIGNLLGVTNYAIHEETLLLLGTASFISPLMFYLVLRKHKETHNPGRKWSGLKNMGPMVRLGIVAGSIGLGAGFIIPLVGTWFLFRFGVGDDYSGPILALSNILIGFSAIASPRLAARFGQMQAILLTTGTSMLFMLSMAFIPVFVVAAVVYVVRSALMNMAGPLIDSFSMTIFPPEQRGVVSALQNITFRLPNSVSTYFGGVMLGLGLLQLPFFIASGLYIVGLVAFYIFFVASRKYQQVYAQTKNSPE